MTQIGENGGVRLLQDNFSGETMIDTKGRYLVESVGKGFLGAWSSTEGLPVIHDKLVSTRGLLTLGNDLERTGQLDRCLEL